VSGFEAEGVSGFEAEGVSGFEAEGVSGFEAEGVGGFEAEGVGGFGGWPPAAEGPSARGSPAVSRAAAALGLAAAVVG
jgi:hypothetical protein